MDDRTSLSNGELHLSRQVQFSFVRFVQIYTVGNPMLCVVKKKPLLREVAFQSAGWLRIYSLIACGSLTCFSL